MNKHFRTLLASFVLIAALPAPALAACAPGSIGISNFLASAAAKPSFDCKKAQTVDETVICSDSALATLDKHLGQLYAAARSALPKPEKDSLIDTQRKWMAGRTPACADFKNISSCSPDEVTGCYSQQYLARMAELQALLTRGNVIREIPGYYLEGAEEFNFVDSRLQSCFNQDGGPFYYLGGGKITKHSTFLIDGRQYLFLNVTYDASLRAPRGADEAEVNESPSEPQTCTMVIAEETPGKGDFGALHSDEKYLDGIQGISDLLTRDVEGSPFINFADEVHQKLPGGEITVVLKNGTSRHFKWNAGTKRYVEGR